jgi:hypothetical protein
MRETRDANRIVRLIDRNVDAFYADRRTYDAFGERESIPFLVENRSGSMFVITQPVHSPQRP